MVKAFASRAADLGLNSHLRCDDFSGLSYTGDLKIGASVAALPGAWHYTIYGVSAGTGRPSINGLLQ